VCRVSCRQPRSHKDQQGRDSRQCSRRKSSYRGLKDPRSKTRKRERDAEKDGKKESSQEPTKPPVRIGFSKLRCRQEKAEIALLKLSQAFSYPDFKNSIDGRIVYWKASLSIGEIKVRLGRTESSSNHPYIFSTYLGKRRQW
jgi:hypothetical protein